MGDFVDVANGDVYEVATATARSRPSFNLDDFEASVRRHLTGTGYDYLAIDLTELDAAGRHKDLRVSRRIWEWKKHHSHTIHNQMKE